MATCFKTLKNVGKKQNKKNNSNPYFYLFIFSYLL